MKKVLLSTAILFGLFVAPAIAADTQPPIKIGEINSYKAIPVYAENYRKGWMLAVEEINATGGIKGRKVEVIDRDDQGKPAEALRVAQDLLLNEKVDFLSGCWFGNVCVALGDFAQKNKIPLMRWFGNAEEETKRESNYAFGLNTLFTNIRAPAQYVLDQNKNLVHWGSLAPNYTYGHQAIPIFENYLKAHSPKADWTDTFWFPLGHLDAGSTIGALQQRNVDGVLNISFTTDFTQFMRAAETRGFDKGKTIVSLESAVPEFFPVLGAECPEGWVMTGYPVEQIHTPEHQAFVEKYKKRWGEMPGWMSLNGYDAYQFIFAAMQKAPTLKPDALVAAMEGLEVSSPVGSIKMRKADHVSTQGIWVGTSHVEGSIPSLRDWKYYSGDQFLIDESKVSSK